ncbi:MAG: methyltransferase domain-containing protein, partial [Candidatus Omnitrophica bacterium]|nr:methyltransferase domain-containing protein [Candidatus Omnitrophota bacterium]
MLSKKRILRVISVILIQALFVSNVAFALDNITLSPPSNFCDEKPKIIVAGSIVADVIVPKGMDSPYRPPTDRSLAIGGDKNFATPPRETIDAYLGSLSEELREGLTVTYGGPAFASAMVLHELGAQVHLIGAVGDDKNGKAIIKLMEEKGMSISGINVIRGIPTSRNLIFSNKDTGDTAYNIELGSANEFLDINHVLDNEALNDASVLHLGGIALNPKIMDNIETLIDDVRNKANNIKIGWDTVVDVYGKECRALDAMRKVDYITPSMAEAVKFTEQNDARSYLEFFTEELGAPAVFLKMGEKGSLVKTAPNSIFGETPELDIPIVNDVNFEDGTGSGDSFSAYIACAVAKGMTAREAAEGATVCGALTCEQRGGGSIGRNPLLSFSEMLKRFRKQLGEEERRFWNKESYEASENGIVLSNGETIKVAGKAFRNRVASAVISSIIGDALYRNGISPYTLISKIRRFLSHAEIDITKEQDPLFAECEFDEITYDEKENAYYLPRYRNGVKDLQYKFYLERKEKKPDMTIPLGNGRDVYVDVEGIGFKQSQTVDAGYVKEMCKLLWRSGGENIILKESRNFREFVLGVVRGHCANKKGISALNIGSSGGRFSNEVSEIMDSGTIINVDIAPLTERKKGNLESFVRADAANLPFDSSSQNLIVSTFLFAYLVGEDKEKAAREMFRVLDNEGKAVLVLHHPNSPLFEEKTLVEAFGVDDRPLKTKLSDCENVLRHLLRAGSLARGGKRLGIPRFQSGYMDKVSYARLLERKPPSSVAAKRAFDELLLTRIRNDIGRFRALLRLLLLQHVKTNLFSNADEINRFFNDVGFHVDEVKPLKANVKGSPEVSYGVVLRKIGKTEDIPVSDRTQTTTPAVEVAGTGNGRDVYVDVDTRLEPSFRQFTESTIRDSFEYRDSFSQASHLTEEEKYLLALSSITVTHNIGNALQGLKRASWWLEYRGERLTEEALLGKIPEMKHLYDAIEELSKIDDELKRTHANETSVMLKDPDQSLTILCQLALRTISVLEKLDEALSSDSFKKSARDLSLSGIGSDSLSDDIRSSSRHYLMALKGYVDVMLRRSKGTTFTIRLPIGDEDDVSEVESSVIEVRSFTRFLCDYFDAKDFICGFDLGASTGRKVEIVGQILSDNFQSSNFVGLEREKELVDRARETGRMVVREDFTQFKDRAMEEGRNLITIFAPYPWLLQDFISAAKRLVANDGLVVVSLNDADMKILLEGKSFSEDEGVTAKDVWRMLLDFTLVRSTETDGWIEGLGGNPYAFIYSPKGLDRIAIAPATPPAAGVAGAGQKGLIDRMRFYKFRTADKKSIKKTSEIEPESDITGCVQGDQRIQIDEREMAVVELKYDEELFIDNLSSCSACIAHGKKRDGSSVYILAHICPHNIQDGLNKQLDIFSHVVKEQL